MKMFISLLVVFLMFCRYCGAARRHLEATDVARAIQLLEDGVRQVEVARRFAVSQSVVSRMWERYQQTGLYHDRSRSGRPRALTARQDQYLRISARRNRLNSTGTLRNSLQNATGVRVSVQTIRNRLHADGLHARRPAVAPRLTPRHRQTRLAFCRAHVDWNIEAWSCVLFSDESRFCVSTNDRRQRVWRARGQRFAECAIVEHDRFGGPSVMVWAGISVGGHTDLYVFQQGPINARIYRDDIILPIVRAYAGAVGPDFLLMDDNAPVHRARLVQECLDTEGIGGLDWPACSPDLNPIEHLWDQLGRAVRRRQQPPTNAQQLRDALTEEWQRLDQAAMDRLIGSMPRRCRACIEARGGHTSY